MYTFRELQKAKKLKIAGRENRLAILCDFSTQLLNDAITGFARLSGINLKCWDAGYNQIDFQLLNPHSELYDFQPNEILIGLCSENLYREFLSESLYARNNFAENILGKIARYWDLILKYSNAKIIQLNFTEIDDKAFGQYSCKTEKSFIYQLRKLNYLLAEAMTQNSHVYPVDLMSVQIDFGRNNFTKASLYYSSKMPITLPTLPFVAKCVIDVIKSIEGRINKCLVLDLDGTLWGGVVGDDGIDGIEIGDYKRGAVYTDLQKYFKQLKDNGIILAVCSKNDEKIAKEPFLQHPDMVLSLEDISVFAANWDDKDKNIETIKDVLNIGFDSIVFLDDNPFERDLVHNKFPEIIVPELPTDPAQWLSYLQNENYFDNVLYPENQPDRTHYYQEEYHRKKSSQVFENIDDYLKDLKMSAKVTPFIPSDYSRIAQLTQRSNQFNLRTVRYDEYDIKIIGEDNNHLTLTFRLRDCYTDYGIISVIILKKLSEEELFIDTWLMSCRVFKRGMENFSVNEMVRVASENGFKVLKGEYIPTIKNAYVKDIYSNSGFKELKENLYELNIDEFKKLDTFIKGEYNGS